MSVAEQIVESRATQTPLPGQVRRSVRNYPVIVDGRQRRIIECECGARFAVTSRAVRLARAQNRELRCRICRSNYRISITPDLCLYWTARFTTAEIVMLAEAIFGPRDTW